ncbi:TolC family outer membrane protein [Methylobacterium aerolatum]|uniref:TolC family outer membrane protein n=1 Tax=Methylobacterium aerolatum TaxID=418708 RepID=UPI002089A04E|nr:Outer membrane efflux protein BepC [Methylobacterium aerolatum]
MSLSKPAHRAALRSGRLAATAIAVTLAASPAWAETLEGALARAYRGNPSLNASRATTRYTDEGVAIAQSGYRPQVSLSADIGSAYSQGRFSSVNVNQTLTPGGAGLSVNQTIFNGFQTDNNVRRAESTVYSQRETLRFTELTVLYSAVQAYMNVLSNTATLELNRNNVEVLEEQLRQTRDRFNVGEVTRTDVAQAEARLAGARSQVAAAESALRTTIGIYRQNIGVEPRALAPGRPLDKFVPATLDAAVAIGLQEHPQIISAMHALDAGEAQVKVLEGQLYPQVSVAGTVAQRYDTAFPGDAGVQASIVGRVTIPIYEGGQVYAQVRQQKELVGQYRIQVDQIRDQVRASVVDFWGRLEAAKAQVIAAQAQVQANEVALNGVREEARVGQRTTLDVLNAQQELLNSRVNLIVAQRDRVIFSYGVVQAMGQLTARFTNLPVEAYSAKIHFDQVKDLWFGLRTPDGR